MVEKQVTIRLEGKGITKLKAAMDSLNTQFKKVGLRIDQLGQIMDVNTKKTITEAQALKRLGKQFDALNMQRVRMGLNRFNRELDKTRMKTNNAKESMGRFKMEMLGLMFFGMAMSAMFIGLLQPALDAYGVFDTWNTFLMTFFLPTAEQVNDRLLNLTDTLDAQSDSTKLAAGNFTLLGAAVGMLFFITGTLVLGLDSLIKTKIAIMGWGALTSVATGIASIGIAALIFWIVAIGVAIALLYTIWKYNMAGIQDVAKRIIDGILNIFEGLWVGIKGVFDVIVGLFEGLITGDFTQFKEGISGIMEGIELIFSDGFGEITGGIVDFLDNTTEMFREGIANVMNIIIEGITGKKTDVRQAFRDMLSPFDIQKKLRDPIKSALGIDVGGAVETKVSLLDRAKSFVYAPEITVNGNFEDRTQAVSLTKDWNDIMKDEFKKAEQGE